MCELPTSDWWISVVLRLLLQVPLDVLHHQIFPRQLVVVREVVHQPANRSSCCCRPSLPDISSVPTSARSKKIPRNFQERTKTTRYLETPTETTCLFFMTMQKAVRLDVPRQKSPPTETTIATALQQQRQQQRLQHRHHQAPSHLSIDNRRTRRNTGIKAGV